MSTATASKKLSKTAWKKSKFHEVTLPSGAQVTMRLPNLPEMAKAGTLPNHLLDAAIGAAGASTDEKSTTDSLKDTAEFNTFIVLAAVVEPADLTEADVADLPTEDVDMIVALATRQDDMDALGHHIGGLHKSSEWRRFRGFAYLDEDLGGV